MPARNLFTALLFLLAAASSWWLYQKVQPTEPVRPIKVEHEPDYFFEDFVVTSMNSQGQPKHRLKGVRMSHYPDDNTTVIEQPELDLYTNAKPVWQINAEQGLISAQGDQVLMSGEVQIKRYGSRQQDTVYVRTRDVLVKPDEKYAETDQLVVITSGNTKVKAVGMRAHIEKGRIELLSNVEGVHAPN